ncbi:hypothetical protein VSDG_09563 [Cytospora chrysosperma]|uniref:Uncharacterized protein n=1 Tax=Cytospora chrysosperma TaxID=252740 RepID=A0A423VA95_CYTCH|nr:hypothetical protein VSDG_09563 [Valsa sordida]
MQLTETVTIINKSGKVISNGKHIVNVFKEAKAAYQDKKAALKAERAATSETRPGIRKTQTYAGPSQQYYAGHEDDQAYELPERRIQYLPFEETRHLDQGDRRRAVQDDAQSHASSRRSHGSHRSKKTRDRSGKSSRPPLTIDNLRTLSEVSSTTPSQVPMAYRSAYVEAATRDNNNNSAMLSRPNLKHAPTAPAAVDLRKKDVDMNLAYGDVPPDLASRTDLGPETTQVEGECESVPEVEVEVNKEAEARTLMERIEALLDEAECFHHTATSIIDHLQRKPEAAAAVALLLAELSTVLKAISPGFLGVVKGGFPAIFALLASPQFLIGVGVAVGVTVVCFGGWKIVKQIKEAKAAKEKALETQGQQPVATASPDVPPPAADDDQSVFDDALVLEEELSAIETWRRGIAPPAGVEMATVLESADLELITPNAARSVRDDGRSIRTTKSHRSSKSHHGHRSRKHEDGNRDGNKDGDVDVPRRKSSKSKAADVESVAGSERSRRSSRSKSTVRTATKAITSGGDQDENTLDTVLRPKDKKPNMLKTMFKMKKDRDDGKSSTVSVMA